MKIDKKRSAKGKEGEKQKRVEDRKRNAERLEKKRRKGEKGSSDWGSRKFNGRVGKQQTKASSCSFYFPSPYYTDTQTMTTVSFNPLLLFNN